MERSVSDSPRGRYFEDFTLGEVLVTGRRTITEADVAAFAGVSGDFNPLHTDQVFGESTPFGGRVAHGMLVASVMTGQVNQAGWVLGTTIALLELTLKFVGAVKFGDTVQTKLEVTEKKETSKPDRGVVTLKTTVLNQRGEPVIQAQQVIMLRRRPGADHLEATATATGAGR
ncbi:MAG: MaoC family dehydratase N-terminal domain-containing protein [Chloroflexi bacterium]|nr:MaoC family dehydratase N-terminal domain-containing protein [Chloroflexota bacterium]